MIIYCCCISQSLDFQVVYPKYEDHHDYSSYYYYDRLFADDDAPDGDVVAQAWTIVEKKNCWSKIQQWMEERA